MLKHAKLIYLTLITLVFASCLVAHVCTTPKGVCLNGSFVKEVKEYDASLTGKEVDNNPTDRSANVQRSAKIF
jgi:hypothetical protein